MKIYTFTPKQLIYVSTRQGLEFLGEYEQSLLSTVTINRARRLHLLKTPVQTPQGVRILSNIELGFVSMCEHSIQSVEFDPMDILFCGVPDPQIAEVYTRTVYGIEMASSGAPGILKS